MNYSRNIRKKAIAKRVIISWVIVAVVSVMIGGLSGYALITHITAKYEQKEEEHTSEQSELPTLVYGAYDGRVFTEEISLDWGNDSMDFEPLDVPMSEGEQEFTYYLCSGYNIDFYLVIALIQHESSYQADIVSPTNDYGLMQINKMNHEYLTETLGVTDYLDPYQNIRAGVFTLRKLFERYQETDSVLMAYNMGEDGAATLWKQGIYETEYTTSILEIQQQLEQEGETNGETVESN